VKGAYREAEDIAYPKKRDVDMSFIDLATQMLAYGSHPARRTRRPAA
jgi:hypothetical protein